MVAYLGSCGGPFEPEGPLCSDTLWSSRAENDALTLVVVVVVFPTSSRIIKFVVTG